YTLDPTSGGWGHSAPDLLTFHRAYLLDFEEALSTVAGRPIALPYWDWPDPDSANAMLAEDFMGPSGRPEDNYVVTSGPFRKGQWPVNVFVWNDVSPFRDLVRAVGVGPVPSPPSAESVQAALNAPLYDVAPWDFTADPTQSFRSAVDGGGS